MSSTLKSEAISAIGAGNCAVQSPSALEIEVVELFDELRDRLLRYLLSFSLPVADCEEVVQEAFLALFQHLRRGKSRSNLQGWLFRVSHNLALKRLQRARRDSQSSFELPLSGEESLVDPSPGPEDQLAQGQTQKRLQAVLKALPEQARRCLMLRAEGLRYRDISEILGMSLGAVSISLERSLAKIACAAERE